MDKRELDKVRKAALSELWNTEVYGWLEFCRQVAKLTNTTMSHIQKRVKITQVFYLAYYLGLRKINYRWHGTEQVFDVEKWCRKLHVAMRAKPKKYKIVIKRKKING